MSLKSSNHETPTLDAALYYPIKGCGGIEINEPGAEVDISGYGIKYDRQFAVVDNDGQPVTSRSCPELATVETQIEEGRLIVSSRLGLLSVSLERDERAAAQDVSLWGRSGTATAGSELENHYFTDLVGQAVQLVRIMQPRPVKFGNAG